MATLLRCTYCGDPPSFECSCGVLYCESCGTPQWCSRCADEIARDIRADLAMESAWEKEGEPV